MTTRSFPGKTALALATAVVLLAAVHRFDPGKGLNPNIFADAVHLPPARKTANATAQVNPTVETVGKTPPAAATSQATGTHAAPSRPAGALEPISPYLIDDSGSLDPFFAALHQLELPAAPGGSQVVTILHYGDSPTTADLITGDVRQLLQSRFGDAGPGYLLAAKPWAWYQHRGVEIDDHGWSISTAVGKGREEVYGIGGASFDGNSGAVTRISLHNGGQTGMEIAYLARPNGGILEISADGVKVDQISTKADVAHPEWHTVTLPAGAKSLELKAVSGSVRLYGESFVTGRRGLLYDSLGLNGASTSVLSNGFNAAAWTAALQHTGPQLVVINYGTNESSFGPYVDKYYEATLRTAIARIRNALPGVPILVMSPMDRGQRTGVDGISTYETIPRIVAIQRRVAAELHCGFFDTFDAMGGEGTMARWYTGQPRLVAGDLIHPTPQGAAIVARLFVKDLSLGYDRYLRRRQPGYQPASQPVVVASEPAKIHGRPSPEAAKPKPPATHDQPTPVSAEPKPSVEPPSTPPTPTATPTPAPAPKAPTKDDAPLQNPAAPPPA